MPHLNLPGVNLWYEDTGGAGTPVIFLHAASGTCKSWVHQLPAFTTAGYRCITYDRRTWGRSQPTDPSEQPGFAGNDLHGLVESLGLERAHLVATAAGGIVGLDYALSHPETRPQPGSGQHHRRRAGRRIPGGSDTVCVRRRYRTCRLNCVSWGRRIVAPIWREPPVGSR